MEFDAGSKFTGDLSGHVKSVVPGDIYGTLPSISLRGYTMLGWFTDPESGEMITSNSTVAIENSHILYAHWEPKSFEIQFNANMDDVENPPSKEVVFDLPIGELPIVSKSGYIFEGWYDQSGKRVDENTLADYQSLTARWIKDAHEHVYSEELTKEATCLTPGVKTFTCICGDKYTEDIPAKGHTEATIMGRAATCEEDGLTYGIKCLVCGEVLIDQVTIKSTGHQFGEWETVESTILGVKITDIDGAIIFPKEGQKVKISLSREDPAPEQQVLAVYRLTEDGDAVTAEKQLLDEDGICTIEAEAVGSLRCVLELQTAAREERVLTAEMGEQTVTVKGRLPEDAELVVVAVPLDKGGAFYLVALQLDDAVVVRLGALAALALLKGMHLDNLASRSNQSTLIILSTPITLITLIIQHVNLGSIGHLGKAVKGFDGLAFVQQAGNLEGGALAHAVVEQVGGSVHQDTGEQSVVPIVVVGQTAHRGFDTGNDYRHIGI